MLNKFEKKLASAKRLKYITIALAVIFFCSFFLIPVIKKTEVIVAIVYPLAMVLLVSFCLYMVKLQTVFCCKNLKKNGFELEDLLDGLPENAPYTYPKSKLYSSDKALVSMKPAIIIPFEFIGWMYFTVKRLYGIVPLTKELTLCTLDGKKYTCNVNEEELKMMLMQKREVLNPNLVIGFTNENRKRYIALKENLLSKK